MFVKLNLLYMVFDTQVESLHALRHCESDFLTPSFGGSHIFEMSCPVPAKRLFRTKVAT